MKESVLSLEENTTQTWLTSFQISIAGTY